MVQKGHVACLSHPELSALLSPGICALLTDAIEAAEYECTGPAPPEQAPLHSVVPPRIPLAAYIERLLKYCRCSPACIAASVVYINRLRAGSKLQVTGTNKHRLVLAGTMIAAKLMDDRCCTNSYYARVGGVTLSTVNEMELCLLRQLGFRVQVTAEDLVDLVRLLGTPTPGTPFGMDRTSHHTTADATETTAPGSSGGTAAVTLQLACGLDVNRCGSSGHPDPAPVQTA